MIWYSEQNDNDIMVSTRIRIARNIKKYPFPARMSPDEADRVKREIKSAIFDSNSAIAKDFEYLEMSQTQPVNIRALTEQHFISPAMAKGKYGSVMINKDRTMSIMVNEEDHIRLQVILSGFRLKEAWETANRVDDLIEENTEYAFDEELGYLTACPSNTGTGLRASVMMHLPALTMTGEMSRIITSAAGLGIAVRGIYGEGSEAMGNLYQISNQVTLGITEEKLIEKVENIAKQIENYEREARRVLEENNKAELHDRIWRAYGILKYCRKISSNEAKDLISDVILGKALNIVDIKTPLIELMVRCEPALITDGTNMDALTRDIKRADFIRSSME